MENEIGNVETDSIVDHIVDLSDHTDFRMHAQDYEQEPILTGSHDAATTGPGLAWMRASPSPLMRATSLEASSCLGSLPLPSLTQPWRLWPATMAPNSQQWIRAGSRTLVRIHWHPEPCL